MQHFSTNIEGVLVLDRAKSEDQRGSFERLYCSDTFESVCGFEHVAQANFSQTSTTGSIRGLHLQLTPESEKKLITCTLGKVFDVAVDMRQGSPTFLNHFSIELNSIDAQSVLIPEGVAHGFQSLSSNAGLIYFHSRNYSPQHEFGFNPFDPRLGIDWPLELTDISDKDANHEFIKSDFTGLPL
jgi:dTDP-4-dehydrorhamnose 3,5-epimerase